MTKAMAWSKFVWSDWARDPALRSVSYAAKGLWMDMLCAMDASPQRGYLVVAGRAATTTEIARILGADRRMVERLVCELEAAAVFSRDERGCVFSRRMTRDDAAAQRNAANGKLGGNPALIKNKDLPVNEVNQPHKADKERDIDKEKKEKGYVESRASDPRLPIDPPAAKPSLPVTLAVDAWNEIVVPRLGGKGRVTKLTDSRRRQLAQRLTDDCGGEIERWRRYCRKIAASSFLTGRVGGRDWVCGFDWILKPANAVKILEGQYDDDGRRPQVLMAVSEGAF